MKPLSKWKINYPPKILCQTVAFYLLHRGNISKIALQVLTTRKYIILCTSNKCRNSQVRNFAMRNTFIRKCLLQNQTRFSRVWEKHQALQFERGYLYSRRKFLRGRKGHRRATGQSHSPGTLAASKNLSSVLSRATEICAERKDREVVGFFWFLPPLWTVQTPFRGTENKKRDFHISGTTEGR